MTGVGGESPRSTLGAVALVVALAWLAGGPVVPETTPGQDANTAGSSALGVDEPAQGLDRPAQAVHGQGRPGTGDTRRAFADTDGDRLADGWERAGETAAGAALPEADPRHKDIYVQVDYGAGAARLSARERAQLRRVWAEMPVENPDGSTGVDLHIDDRGPRGGAANTTVEVPGTDYTGTHRYYTAEYLGPRLCRYHQVAVGSIAEPDLAGRATIPGYAVVVESDPPSFGGNVSSRVAIVTHELLHNVVGRVDGDIHVERGWLADRLTADDTSLSNTTARRLNESGFRAPTHFRTVVC